MIPVRKIDTLVLFLGIFLFTGAFDAMLTTFDPNIGGSDSAGNLKMQATSGMIYLIVFSLLFIRIEKFLKFSSRNLLIFLFLLIPVFSCFWSIAPETTLRRVIALLGTSFFGVYMAFAFPPDRVLRTLALIYALVAAASAFFIVALPNYGVHQIGEYAGVWRGVYAQKNEFGAAMAMAVLALILCPKYTRMELVLSRGAILLCFFFLVMSESRAAWLSLAIATFIAVPLHQISGRGTRSAIKGFGFVFAVVILGGLIFHYSEQILGLMGKDATLTGRTGVWELTLNQAMLKPILGYGYRAYWITDNKLRLQPTENWSDEIGHAHNTYVDMFAELGFLGIISFTILLCVMIWKFSIRITRHFDFINAWALSFVTFILVRGFAESTMLQHADINWVLFVYFFVLMNELSRSKPAKSLVKSLPLLRQKFWTKTIDNEVQVPEKTRG